MGEYQHYRFDEFRPGVVAGVALPGGAGLSNTGIVRLEPGSVLFDTTLSPAAFREVLGESRERTGGTPTAVANSHWHLDHILGNQEVAHLSIYATERTVEIVTERRESLQNELRPATLERDIRELEAQRDRESSPAARAHYDLVLAMHRALLRQAAEMRVTPPNQPFRDRLRLPGAAGAELVTFGGGHTESDAVLFLPQPRVLFAGDLVVVGTHPNVTSGDPEQWLRILERIRQLGVEKIVPGHGPVAGPEALDSVAEYLETLLHLGEEDRPPELPERYRSWTSPEQFQENWKYLRQRGSSA
jgi:glyoxylase-like metal-dependent hydrolase (beta-lactamase superfamily II)